MQLKKIGIIGAGDIGLNLAEILALDGYNVIIYNRYHAVDNIASPYWLNKVGKIMDMNDSLQLPGCGEVVLSYDLNSLNNVEALIITSGAKRTHIDETREELASKNANIIAEFSDLVANNKFITLIISNPVDFLTQYLIELVANKTTQAKNQIANRIIGVSYIDTMRLKNLVREFYYLSHEPFDKPLIDAIVIGEHGPTMVPLMSSIKINDQSLEQFADLSQIKAINDQTILRGNDIIKLTGASSVLGPAHAVKYLIDEILFKETTFLPCSVWDNHRSIGRLAKFSGGLFVDLPEVKISASEQEKLRFSEQALDHQFIKIKSLI